MSLAAAADVSAPRLRRRLFRRRSAIPGFGLTMGVTLTVLSLIVLIPLSAVALRALGQSPEHFLEIFRNYYGPMLKAFAALDAANQQGLRDDLLALIGRMNRAEDGTMIVPSEYLEIVITRR